MTRRVAHLLCAAVLAGCASFGPDGPTNRCEADEDCVSGSCAVDMGMCVSTPDERYRVGIEVLPVASATGGTPILTSFEAFDLEGPMDRDLALPTSVRTSGVVRDRATGDPVTATVSFTTRSAFEGGQSTRITAQSRAEVTTDDAGRPVSFTAGLLPGRHYDITVTPSGDWASTRPPLRVRETYESASGVDAYLAFLEYPDLCSPTFRTDPPEDASCLAVMEGTVVDTSGAAQDGMLVRVLSAETGQVVSSTYVTGSDEGVEPGYFRVVLNIRDWLAGWVYSVTPGAARVEELGPGPSFTADPSALFEEAGRVTILTPDVSNVVTYRGLVESAADGAPLANATVAFHTRNVEDAATGVVGTFHTSVTSESSGIFEARLLPGDYEVVVTPESTSDLALYRTTLTIGAAATADIQGQAFPVPRRAPLQGTVRTADGMGVMGAQVRARPRGVDWMGSAEDVAALARVARSNSTYTDIDGRYGLGLDIGVFDLVAEPPSGSNFPWQVRPDERIGTGMPLGREFELAAPVTVSGAATFDGVTPVVGAEVRAYAIIDGDVAPRVIQIGRAETGADGRFVLLLPPSI